MVKKSKVPSSKALIEAMLAQAMVAPVAKTEVEAVPESPVEVMVKSAIEVINSQKEEAVSKISKAAKPGVIRSEKQGLAFGQWFALFLRSALVRGLNVKGSYEAIEARYLKAFNEGKAVKALLDNLSKA